MRNRNVNRSVSVASIALGAGCLLAALPGAHAAAEGLTEITMGTSWFAQAEHGGFYQAKATGIYEEYGLDVTIEMGGPQVNGLQLLLAGNRDFTMGYPLRNLQKMEDDLPVVTVAASMQRDPQCLLSHPHIESFEEMKGKDVLVASSSETTFWPWLKQEYGFTDAMREPYTFSIQPFLNDKDTIQQGYVTSEPFAIEQGGVDPNIFLFADYGYPPYATTIETTRMMVEENPEVVRKFVQATMEGWKSYFDNPEPGNQLIQADNPDMSDAQIAFGIDKMQEYGLVTGGDAKEQGIGVMTHERWRRIYEFMAGADLVDEDIDWKKAYTLKFLPDTPVLPASE